MVNRIVLALVIVGLAVQPAAADPGISFLPQTTGQRVHYRIVQTAQTANGPQTSTFAFDLVRRTGVAVVIERNNPDGTPNLSVLKTVADGSLALAEDPSGAAADIDIPGLLAGINLAIAATHANDASAHAAWTATVPVATTPGAESATISLAPANVAGNDFDFSGTGSPAPPASSAPPERQGGRRGGSGSGFPGGAGGGLSDGGGGGGSRGGPGAFPGISGSSNGRPAAANTNRNGMTYVVHVEGHVSSGRVRSIAITETRSVTVANTPFFNVASWAITVLN
jgi:uncharacterized membrane protein YgcG